MSKAAFILTNIILSPVLALAIYPVYGPAFIWLNPDSAFYNVILPVAFSSLILSILFIFGLNLAKKELVLKKLMGLTIISVIISSICSPVTFGFVTMGSYLIYCKFGSC
jgi:hypothetical protein